MRDLQDPPFSCILTFFLIILERSSRSSFLFLLRFHSCTWFRDVRCPGTSDFTLIVFGGYLWVVVSIWVNHSLLRIRENMVIGIMYHKCYWQATLLIVGDIWRHHIVSVLYWRNGVVNSDWNTSSTGATRAGNSTTQPNKSGANWLAIGLNPITL